MRIAYIANARIPTEKAHGYQIMRVCGELAKLGHEVILCVPKRANAITDDAFAFYGVAKNFTLTYVPCFDWIRYGRVLGPLAFVLQMRAFVKALARQGIPRDTVVYTRDAALVQACTQAGFACVYNAHNWPANPTTLQHLLKGAKGIVCNSKGTEEAVQKTFSLPTVVLHNAADQNPYVGNDKKILRRELGLPEAPFVALYAGHLYGWKGAEIIFEAASSCPDATFVVVGGTAADLARARKEHGTVANLMLLGHKPKVDIPKYLAAADVLLLPNSSTTEESVRYTSPIKMFEYMASGAPIVSSDLPSLREVLHERLAVLVEADNAQALVQGIERVVANQDGALALATAALEESKQYTWEAHATRLAEFLVRVVG